MVNAVMTRGSSLMKKLAIATAAVLALLSIAGCANTGKGKAPPPVVTKG
jgi:predicted small lipoprotein YifL